MKYTFVSVSASNVDKLANSESLSPAMVLNMSLNLSPYILRILLSAPVTASAVLDAIL